MMGGFCIILLGYTDSNHRPSRGNTLLLSWEACLKLLQGSETTWVWWASPFLCTLFNDTPEQYYRYLYTIGTRLDN